MAVGRIRPGARRVRGGYNPALRSFSGDGVDGGPFEVVSLFAFLRARKLEFFIYVFDFDHWIIRYGRFVFDSEPKDCMLTQYR